MSKSGVSEISASRWKFTQALSKLRTIYLCVYVNERVCVCVCVSIYMCRAQKHVSKQKPSPEKLVHEYVPLQWAGLQVKKVKP